MTSESSSLCFYLLFLCLCWKISGQGWKNGGIMLHIQLDIFIFLHCSNYGYYWELPSCGTFVAFSIQGGNNLCSSESALWYLTKILPRYWQKRGETLSKWFALLATLLHHCFLADAQYFNACDRKPGNPTEWQFPSASSSSLTLYQFTTSKTGTYHLHWERQENTFSASWIFHWALAHLSVSLWCEDTSIWNSLDLKQ